MLHKSSGHGFQIDCIEGLAEVLAARRACALNNVPKNRQKQFYKQLEQHLPTVSTRVERLQKDGSITDLGTKSKEAVKLLQSMKINDGASDPGTVRALEILDKVGKNIRAETLAVLGAVNGHDFARL